MECCHLFAAALSSGLASRSEREIVAVRLQPTVRV
jgi:hypothetical protein